jgi:cell division protein FtsW (lipid II flippase)
MFGGKVAFLRGLSFNSGPSSPVAIELAEGVTVVVALAVVVVVVVVVVGMVDFGRLSVVAVVVVVVVVVGMVDFGRLTVVAVLVVVLFSGCVEIIDDAVDIAFIIVLENNSTEDLKASDGAAVKSRSMCFSVGDIGVDVGSMTGRNVVVKSMC